MNRVHVDSGKPVLPRSTAHKLFLRELADYRANLEPARRLETHAAADVRLFAASFREAAERALERALHGARVLVRTEAARGAFDRLRSREPQAAAPALEHLGHVLPRAIFRPVTKIFECPLRKRSGKAAPRARRCRRTDPFRMALGGWMAACLCRARSRHAPSSIPGCSPPAATRTRS